MTEDLSFAARLIELGVPVFLARAAPDGGFRLPNRWQTSRPTPDVLNRWKPGDALCAVTGHTFDVIDVDPRNGGTPSTLGAARGYALVATPGGGWHLYVRATGLASKNGIMPGVDFKAGTSDGSGRGFVYIPPTVRPHGAYSVLGAVAAPDPDDTSGAWLVRLYEQPNVPTTPAGPAAEDPPPPAYVARIHEEWKAYGRGERPGAGWQWLQHLVPRAIELGNELGSVSEQLALLRQQVEARRAHGGGATDAEWANMIVHWRRKVGGKGLDRAATPTMQAGDKRIELAPPKESGSPEESEEDLLSLTPASQITPIALRWVWNDRVLLRNVTLLAGRPALGKSTIGYDITAALTVGTLPGEFHGTPKDVLVVSTEDGWAETIVPRLIVAGADLNRVYRINATERGELTLPEDADRLARTALSLDTALVLLDPLMSRVGGELDTHKDNEVRLALEPLVPLAEKAGIGILGLIHLNKSGSNDIIKAMMGSVAFGAVARSVLVAGKDPDDPARRFLAVGKGSNRPDGSNTLEYEIQGATLDQRDPYDGREIQTSKITWKGETPVTVEELLANDGGKAGAPRRADPVAISGWVSTESLERGGGISRAEIVEHFSDTASRSAIDKALKLARDKKDLLDHRHGLYFAPGFLARARVVNEKETKNIEEYQP